MIPSNYHTHTTYCDGKNTPEEMVLEAIRLGCPELGFSGHSYMEADTASMSLKNTRAYIAEIRALQKKYAGEIKILLGIEQDYYSPQSTDGYDYVLGSVHFVKKDGVYLSIDHSKEIQMNNVRQYYGGDYYSLVEDYFALVADVYRKTRCQIIGHFDQVTKFNQNHELFDPNHPRYQAAANKALDALLDTPAILEVNTGAISRGYTDAPYPARDILERWRAAGKEIIFSSDCHSKEHLLFGYDLYQAIL